MGWEGTGGKSRGFLADSPLMARIFGRTEKRHRYSEYGTGKIFRFSGGNSLASKSLEHLLYANDPPILARSRKIKENSWFPTTYGIKLHTRKGVWRDLIS